MDGWIVEMKILVVGSGGREHALAWKIARSPRVSKVFCAPGNAGIAGVAACVDIAAGDIEGLLGFARKERIDLTVVGPEIPLVEGIVDVFNDAGLKIFGPSREAARLEGSKNFAKDVMRACGVPTAGFRRYTCPEDIERDDPSRLPHPLVIKADGLAAGKGVIISPTPSHTGSTISLMVHEKVFGQAGETFLVEEYLQGEEASILVLTNGRDVIPLASSQDHKRVFDKDEGPNTGGMGAYSPAPVVTDALMRQVMETIVRPVIAEMARRGTPYTGILYAGIMVTRQGPKVLEFNVRFGDPETQAVLARLEGDLVDAMLWTLDPEAPPVSLSWDARAAACVVMASGGYPGDYEKGKPVRGLDAVAKMPDVVVFHAGTKRTPQAVVTSGGRVLGVTGLGATVKDAVGTAYKAVKMITFDGAHYRTDIGRRALRP
ncbi:MAG: phosphoribosylamine--glycine ligase [Deltaproteobacteria bacterium]